MGIKVYISGISGNKEVKKRQQRVLLILDSKNVKYDVIDIAEPGAEEVKDFMQSNSTALGGTISDPNPRHPLPPQIYNDDLYCGDYDLFDMANEIDEMEKFLKLESADAAQNIISNAEIKLKNGEVSPDEQEALKEEETHPVTEETEAKENEVSNEQENIESEEKLTEEQHKESIEADDDTKAVEEPAKDVESVSDASEPSEESKVKEESKDEHVAGAGDDHGEHETEASSKTDDEKADE